MSQRPLRGRVTPRWSWSGQTAVAPSTSWIAGLTAPSMAKESGRGACVIVGPPLSASASSRGGVATRSRVPRKWQSVPPSMLPPSEPQAPLQSGEPRFPATIELWKIAPMLGTIGKLIDSIGLPTPLPAGARFWVTVVWITRRPASASTYTPPPATSALLPEIVVFSISVSASDSW